MYLPVLGSAARKDLPKRIIPFAIKELHIPRLKSRVPAYCQHSASGQARVKLGGEYIYLGPHGSQTTRNEYDRLIAEWLATGRRSATTTRRTG